MTRKVPIKLPGFIVASVCDKRTPVTSFNVSICLPKCPFVHPPSPRLSVLSSVGLGPDLPTATQPETEKAS